MRRMNCLFVLGLIGLFCFVLGVGLAWFGTKSLIRMWAFEKLTIKNDSEAMTRWIRSPEPILLKVYFFNVTNPDAVSEGALPIFNEVGPYVYEQRRQKINIVRYGNYTLSYQLKNNIQFKQSRSGGLKDTDLVTIINVPLVGSIASVYEAVPEFVGMLNDIWRFYYPNQKNIFITTSVKNVLFDGITIDCSSKITKVYIGCRGMETWDSSAVRKEGKSFKFSFFYAKNGTSPETYQINQGIFDLTKSAQFVGINNSPLVDVWDDYYCNMINGSDGAQFSILLDKRKRLYVYEKEFCRSVYAEFEKEVYSHGVLLYKYVNTKSLFASPEENPENKCFCRSPMNLRDIVEKVKDGGAGRKKEDASICFENGVLPLMPCVGAPIAASFPHFYLGDQIYINYTGLNPVKKLHESYAYVEPTTGLTVLGSKKIQFNVELKRIFDVDIISNVIEGLFPVIWIEERMQLPSELFKLLKYNLIEKKILEIGTLVLIGIGLFLIFVSFFAPILLKKVKYHEKPEIDLKESELKVIGSIRSQPSAWQTNDQTNFNEFQKQYLIDNFFL